MIERKKEKGERKKGKGEREKEKEKYLDDVGGVLRLRILQVHL